MMHTQTTRPRPQPKPWRPPRPGPSRPGRNGQPRPAGDRPQNAPTARSKSRRGIGPRGKALAPAALVPLDRNAKARVMMVARTLMRHPEQRREEEARRLKATVRGPETSSRDRGGADPLVGRASKSSSPKSGVPTPLSRRNHPKSRRSLPQSMPSTVSGPPQRYSWPIVVRRACR
jgi:hypothetical protein